MASSSLKTFFVLLLAVGLTAAFTYLMVSNHYQRERVERLRAELARVEADRALLEEEMLKAQAQLRAAHTSPSPLVGSRSVTNSPRVPAPPPVVPRVAVESPETVQFGAPAGANDGLRGSDQAPVIAVFPPPPAAGWAHYVACPTGSVCVIEGKVGKGKADAPPWRIEGRLIAGSFDIDARFDLRQPVASQLRWASNNIAAHAEVSIPIRSLKSQAAVGASAMDGKLQMAMNARKYPNIHYRLTSLNLELDHRRSNLCWLFKSLCELSMNGVTNGFDGWGGIIEPVGADHLKVSAMLPLCMTDFEITPPSETVAGVKLQAEDLVTVHVTWMLVREDPAAAAR